MTKDCDAPAGLEPSTVSVLDPETLLPVAAAAAPSRALDRPAGQRRRERDRGRDDRRLPAAPRPRRRPDRDRRAPGSPSYGPAPERSYGWDPVITDEHVFWMDNGRNHTDRTMLGSGEQASPVRLWWARRDDDDAALGRDQRPPLRDRVEPARLGPERAGSSSPTTPATRSSAPGASTATSSSTVWRRDGLAHAGHLIVYPDTRELVVQDWTDWPAMRRPSVRPADPDRRVSCSRASRPATARIAAHRLATQLVVLRPRQRRGARSRRRAVGLAGVPVPRAGLRARRLLPVADHDRPRRGRLSQAPAGANATASAIAAAIAAGSSICG